MSESRGLGALAAEGARPLFDPMTAPVWKFSTMVFGSLTLGEWGSIVAITYGLVCLVIASPKLVRTVRWWWRWLSGAERRRPFAPTDPNCPRRRESDTPDKDRL